MPAPPNSGIGITFDDSTGRPDASPSSKMLGQFSQDDANKTASACW